MRHANEDRQQTTQLFPTTTTTTTTNNKLCQCIIKSFDLIANLCRLTRVGVGVTRASQSHQSAYNDQQHTSIRSQQQQQTTTTTTTTTNNNNNKQTTYQ
jgi:hypothetical protein